jgi:predicted Zn-dependent protease
MASEREALFRKMVEEFPESPMGFFSLGKLLLEERRTSEAAATLDTAVRLDPAYSAAWVALGDAWAAESNRERACAAWQSALRTPLGGRDLSLQADVEARIRALDEF